MSVRLCLARALTVVNLCRRRSWEKTPFCETLRSYEGNCSPGKVGGQQVGLLNLLQECPSLRLCAAYASLRAVIHLLPQPLGTAFCTLKGESMQKDKPEGLLLPCRLAKSEAYGLLDPFPGGHSL